MGEVATPSADPERRLRATSTLLAIARLVEGVPDVGETLRLVCRELARMTGADAAGAHLVDAAGLHLRPVAGYRVPPSVFEQLSTSGVPLEGQGYSQGILQRADPVWSDDVPADPRFSFTLFRDVPHQSGVLVPLARNGAIAGTIYLVWWRERRRLDDDELAVLRAAGQQVGLFLRTARLLEDKTLRAERLAVLTRVNRLITSSLDTDTVLREIARAAGELMGAAHVSFWVVEQDGVCLAQRAFWSADADGDELPVKQLLFGEGGVGWVALHREPLVVDDVVPDPRFRAREWARDRGVPTFLGLPVELDGRLLAVLSLNGRRPFVVDADTRDVLVNFIAQAAVALRNASLFASVAAARDAAQAAARAKSDFLAMISHEIRTPMHGIIGMTDLALGTTLSGEQRQYLTAVQVSADALLGLINNVLDFSRLDAGRLALDRQEFSLREALDAALLTLALPARRKGLELVCDVAPDVPDGLVGDAGRLRQVLVNLLGNAVKFTERGDVVLTVATAETAPSGPAVALAFGVADTGIGIPADKQATIFEPFTQADGSITRRYGGTGLGLTICARFVRMMGGRIDVQSAPGRGSRFGFTARFERGAPTDERRPAPRTALAGRRALIVDDHPVARAALAATLCGWGLRVVPAASATEALATLRDPEGTGGFAVVIVSAELPEPGGFAVMDRARRGAGAPVPAIGMVAVDRYALDATRCRDAGARALVTRPVGARALADALDEALAPPAPPAPEAEPARPARAGLRILVAEDNAVNQQLATRLLEKQGHVARVVADGAAAVAAVRETTFDLVLMDLHMPDMDGVEATTAIRAHERRTGGGVCIVALTADARPDEEARCLAAGMQGVLTKPLRAATLAAAIQRFVPDRSAAIESPPAAPAAILNAR